MPEEQASIFYHSIFDYPLRKGDLSRWYLDKRFLSLFPEKIKVVNKDDFYFVSNKEFSVPLRKRREKFSKTKVDIAKRASSVVSFLPTIRLVALTGSVAVGNADIDSDIDLMIIVRRGFLWTTRFFVYFLLLVFGVPFRRSGVKNAKDRLCLNIWLDERALAWTKKNIFKILVI